MATVVQASKRHAKRRSSPRLDHLVFAAVVVTGLVVRSLAMSSTWQQPDGDQAVGMIMALRASQGHFSLLFWGGDYGGALITWVEAPLVAIFGFTTTVFTVVNTILTLLAAVLLRSVARRWLRPVTAAVVGAAFTLYPALWVFWSDREYVFWLPAIVFGLASGLAALRWRESRSVGALIGCGLLAGLAVWCYPLILAGVLPPLVFVLWTLRRDLRSAAIVVITAAVGVLPWALYFILHGRHAAHLQQTGAGPWETWRHALTQVLPFALVGEQKRVDVVWLVTGLSPDQMAAIGIAVYLFCTAYTVIVAVRRDTLRTAVGLGVMAWPFALTFGHVPVSSATFRYGFIIVPLLLLIAGDVLQALRLPLLLAIACITSSVVGASASTDAFASVPTCNPSLTVTDRYLQAQHRSVVWASYWLAGPLDVCGDQHIIASPVAYIRDVAARHEAESTSPSTYVVFVGNVNDTVLQSWSASHPGTVQRVVVGGYAVWQFQRRVEPSNLGLTSAF